MARMEKFGENEIRNIAKDLGWQFEETKIAHEELYESESIVKDWCAFIIKCMSFENPKQRQHKVTEYLIESLQGDLVRTICNLLYNSDPCFGVLVAFNARGMGKRIYYPKGRKSFLIPGVLLGQQPLTMGKGEKADPMLNPYELSYGFLDSLVLHKSEGSNDKLEALLFDVVGQSYFLSFNIKPFRDLVAKWSHAPHMRKKGIRLAAALYNSFSKHHKEMTEAQYWTYFVLVEKLKDRYGVRGAFREAGRRLGEPATSIQRRYVDMKKKARKQRLSLEGITKKYELQKALEDLLAEYSWLYPL